MIFKFEKPIYGSYFMIWDKWLKIAKKKSLNIIAESEFGTSTYTYKTWMDGATKGEHEHNFPGNPMIFWGRHVLTDIKARKERKKEEKKEEVEEEISIDPKIEFQALKVVLNK